MFFFVCIGISLAHANGTGKQESEDIIIQINVDSVSIKEVFRIIKDQTEFVFTYTNAVIENTQKVSFHGRFPIQEIFEELSKKYNLRFNRINKNISVIKVPGKREKKADRVINGTVKDSETGEPIPGASVLLMGFSKGTATDFDGNFTMTIPDDAQSLQVSSMGYATREIPLGEQDRYVIDLKPDLNTLSEVVVVGYGTQKKENLTGAVASVDMNLVEDRSVPRLSQMLQGTVPNMTIKFGSGYPGAAPDINIRGVNSISGTAKPLVLIDGIEGNLDRLNPNDVASISVLKDASASAIYGARAAYGVVLVTTKKGRKGKMNIQYNGSFSLSSFTTSTDYESRGYYSAGINDLFFNSYNGRPYTNYTEDDYYQLWIRRNDKTEHPDRPWVVVDQRDGKDTYVYYGNTDWHDYLFQENNPMWQHNISLSGASDKINYFLSGNIVNQEGVFKISPDVYKVANFRSKVSVQATPNLEVSNNTRYYYNNYSYPGRAGINNNFHSGVHHALASIVPVNPDGSPVYLTSMSNYQVLDGIGAMLINDKHKNTDKKYEFATTLEAVYKISDALNIKGNYTYQHYNYQTKNRKVNIPYSQYPGEYSYITTGIGTDELGENQINHWYHAVNAYAEYEKKFSRHHLKTMVGYNYETRKLKDLKMSRQGLLSEDLSDFNLATGDVMNIIGGQNEYAIMGAFYRVNYDFDNQLLLELSGRIDGTSRFRKGHRYGFFPSVSAGWKFSEAAFFSGLRPIIPLAKLRLSYGSLGNQLVGYYDYMQTINTGQRLNYSFGNGSKAPYAYVSDPNDPNLTWEKVITRNIGLDLAFFDHRFTASGDYYIRDTRGMLTSGKSLPATYGASEPKQNAADLSTRGWEIAMKWSDYFSMGNSPFSYSISFNLADNKSRITKFDNPSMGLDDYYKGQNLGEIWGYEVDGYFKTDEEASGYPIDQSMVNQIIDNSQVDPGLHAGDMKFVDLNGDQIISQGANTVENPGDRKVIGNSLPRYTYGATFTASWKGLDLSVFMQGVGRQDWYPGTNAVGFWGPYSRPYSTFIPSDFLSKVWSEENPDAFFPRPRGYIALGNNRSLGVVNNRYLQNLAYLRLKNLTVGYTLPSGWNLPAGMEKARIYLSGENLITFTKLESDYIDPEQAGAENTIDSGSSNAKLYPWSRVFTVGVNINF